jgi:hypothetical protein
MSLQLTIPGRVALQQSPLALRQLDPSCNINPHSSIKYQRTVNPASQPCLTSGGRSTSACQVLLRSDTNGAATIGRSAPRFHTKSGRRKPSTVCNEDTEKCTPSAHRLFPSPASRHPNPARPLQPLRQTCLSTRRLRPARDTPRRRHNRSAIGPAARRGNPAYGRRSLPSPNRRTRRQIASRRIHRRCTMDKGYASNSEISPSTPAPRRYSRGCDCRTNKAHRSPL